MNHLAHLFLSCDCPERQLGNFIADAVHPAHRQSLPKRVREGINLHHAIDAFTDSHPEVLEVRSVIRPRFRKYAPVACDVYFDYLLAVNWTAFSEESLTEFSKRTYDRLLERIDWHPEPLRRHLPAMVEGNWLVKYGTQEGMERSFKSLQRRASKPDWLENQVAYLIGARASIEPHFLRFFPDLVTHANQVCLRIHENS
ncbi:MAG: ACP phosphodiesterase [Saprospiraceae bacterium]|jgi:acyl carrier protein phosphodiesterase